MKTFLSIITIAFFIIALPLFVFAQPVVIITPSSGVPADEITIEGKGFQPDEEVDIIITLDEDEKVALGTVEADVIKTDANGSFSVKSGIPINAKPGTYKVDVLGNKGTQLDLKIEVKAKDKK